MSFEKRYQELLSELESHLGPDHFPRNYLGERLPLDCEVPSYQSEPVEGEYIVEHNGALQLWYTERGTKRLLFETHDSDEFFYRVFKGITQSLATSFEARNRNPETSDTRVDWFLIQEKLLGKLSLEWQKRLEAEHEKIITKRVSG